MRETQNIPFKIATSKPKDVCCAYRCLRKRAKRQRFCAKHWHRYQKAVNPTNYVYNFIKSNARRRGKDFTLTLQEFTEFCERTGYLHLRGKSRGSATIDRKDNSIGYSVDNIRLATLSENARKGDTIDYPF